jgi:plastocyanin domain-containing protein
MSIDKVIVAIGGVIGIIFTYWFFLMKKDKVVKASDSIDIIVDGGYNPSTISIPKGKTTKINFNRKDPSGCLEEVILPDFKIRKFLPLNKRISVELTPKKRGEFGFECGMGMFHGKIIVK